MASVAQSASAGPSATTATATATATPSAAASAKKLPPLPVAQLNHISREVKELDASVHFYVNVMGMEMIPRPKFGVPGAWVYGHGTAIHLVQSSDTDLRQQVRDRRKEHFDKHTPSVDHIAFLLESFDGIEDQLKAHGLEFKKVDAVTGGIQYFIYDPDFNRIELGTCAPPVGKITCAEPEQA